MKLSRQEMLTRLGQGDSIDTLCGAAGLSRAEFDAWWRRECAERVPSSAGEVAVEGLESAVRVLRDARGLPHIRAHNDADLMIGLGYVTAQDRLFQLDYLRRRACGRLAEVLGPSAVESDVLYRTLDLARIAEAEWRSFDAATRSLLDAYAAGVNAAIRASRGRLPVEFDLLGYEPEPWRPQDSLALVGEFRWYLTGRFPVIVVPEIVKRAVGEGALYRAFLAGEIDDECILPPGSYPRRPTDRSPPVPSSAGSDDGPGSNNWVLSGRRTESGRPLLASDPHVPFAAVSIWHEVHLQGGSFHVAGIALAGMPGILIGRNPRVAWGITNNICSQRDLYQERTDPAHPGCFLDDGSWRAGTQREELIRVRGGEPVRHIVRSSHNGPLVDELLPPPARGTGPVSLRWLGFERCGLVPSVLAMNRAGSAEEFQAAMQPWLVPTFSVVFADIDGHIGYQCAGRIPLRHVRERGYRPGWDPQHRWDGTLPLEGMPRLRDPERGFLVTANNRVAPDDYAWPLSGTWVTGYRARRIRALLEAQPRMSRDDHRRLQLDVHSGRAAICVPLVVSALADESDARLRGVAARLATWDCQVRRDSVAASVFHVFFVHWCRAVAAERVSAEAVELVAAAAGPLAVRLLHGDDLGWFQRRERSRVLADAFRSAVDELATRLGDDADQWQWGRLHSVVQKHFLSGRGDLGLLLDIPPVPADGEGQTVNSATPDASHHAWLGAGFRFVADLSDSQAGYWSVEIGSASGHPGSTHYSDQLDTWLRGEMYYTALHQPAAGELLVLAPLPVPPNT